MPSVAPVRLTYNPKILWFDPKDLDIHRGDALIVKTERGQEYAIAEEDIKEVDETAIAKLKSPLKPVIRKATDEDARAWQEIQAAAAEALPVFKEMVAEQGLDMHPVAVEFLFDGDKAVFYFEAEERVDFRELVRTLASRFHKRIDMRQIGVRDEARIVGGFGHCGQELCCKRLGGEFNPVSIRMAKDQDLSLNPQKISGVCGRLMCCLRYEADAYKEFKGRCPKVNSMISTPEGDAKVVEINVPRETVTIDHEGKRIKIPVSEMEIDPKTGKPGSVSQDVLDEYANRTNAGASMIESLVSPIFTGTDKLADKPVARRAAGGSRRSQQNGRRAEEESPKKPTRRRRNRAGRTLDEGSAQQGSSRGASQEKGRERRGDSSKKGGKAGQQQSPSKRSNRQQQASQQQGKQQESRRNRGSVRPGQRSSGLAASSKKSASPAPRKDRSAQQQAPEHRKSRRRSHKAQGGEGRQN